jgi:hypothetical protein
VRRLGPLEKIHVLAYLIGHDLTNVLSAMTRMAQSTGRLMDLGGRS